MDNTTKGILTPRDIDEEGRYYFVRKAIDAGEVVRLKNGLYATEDGLADTMVDVERIVPGGVVCLYSAWEHYGLTTQMPGSIYVAVEKHRKVVVPEFPPITLCYWEQKYYEMGVVETEVAGHRLRIYDIVRCGTFQEQGGNGRDDGSVASLLESQRSKYSSSYRICKENAYWYENDAVSECNGLRYG